jgi:hypothetical protein
MEKFQQNSKITKWYRDVRGGDKYFLDMILPKPITDVLHFATKELECGTCKVGTWAVRTFFGSAPVTFFFGTAGILLCELAIPFLTGYKRSTCPGLLKQQWTGSIYPIFTQELFDEKIFCVYNLNVCQSLDYNPRDLREDVFDILQSKPEIAKSNDFINKLYDSNRDKFNTKGRETIKIAMMSDLHIDYNYVEGNDNECGKILCCRVDSGVAPTKARAAGKWGDFNCDLNEKTMHNMFDFIESDIKPEAVLWGGDSIPHNVDTLNLKRNVEIVKNITHDVKTGLHDFQIFPTIGNHDTYPQDVIKMSIPRSNEAINQWMPTWKDFFTPDMSQWDQFQDWGYYSMPFVNKQGEPIGNANTKIISMNNNICYQFNWETITMYEDPGKQLEWMEKELGEIEANNGTAILLSHVPILDECNQQYGRRYHAIVDRFQHIIRWGMYAHIHKEQFQVVRDIAMKKPILQNFIIGSATTYQGKEPSFNVIHLDPDTMLPVELQTYAFDLKHANEFDEPKWRLMYNYTDTYNMKDMSPESFFEVSQ